LNLIGRNIKKLSTILYPLIFNSGLIKINLNGGFGKFVLDNSQSQKVPIPVHPTKNHPKNSPYYHLKH